MLGIIAKPGLKLNKKKSASPPTLEALSASKESAQIQKKYEQFRNFHHHRMYPNCSKHWALSITLAGKSYE